MKSESFYYPILLDTSTHSIYLNKKIAFPAKVDIVFLLDGSTRVGPRRFKLELSLFDTVAQSFPVEKDGVYFAGVVYSSASMVSFQLNANTDKPTLSKAIQAIPYIGGGARNVGQAIASVKSGVFDFSGRPGVPRVVVVLMLKTSDDDMVVPATSIKGQGAKLIMLGIGKGVDPSKLAPIASSPDFVLVQKPMRELGTQAGPLVGKINSGKY